MKIEKGLIGKEFMNFDMWCWDMHWNERDVDGLSINIGIGMVRRV